ncbi:MAG: amidase [Candidatus Poribacteria bacterium]|nr:MAG: amidase [Candidatus Poribacteria bacterium]
MAQRGEVRLERLTRAEAWDRIQSGEVRVVLVPTGSLEQHRRHLAMDHDIHSAVCVAEEVARRLAPSVLVTVPLNAGISEHHMVHRFGSITLKPGTFQAVLWDTVDSLVRHGVRKIVILNGHGGNVAPMEGSINQYRRYFEGVDLHFLSYWDVLPREAVGILETGVVPGHATEFETALAMYLFPESVREPERQADPDPGVRSATAEKGERLFAAIVEAVVQYVQKVADGSRRAEINDGLSMEERRS